MYNQLYTQLYFSGQVLRPFCLPRRNFFKKAYFFFFAKSLSRRIAVQQDQNIFEEHVFILPPRHTNSNFSRNKHIPIKQNGF